MPSISIFMTSWCFGGHVFFYQIDFPVKIIVVIVRAAASCQKADIKEEKKEMFMHSKYNEVGQYI